MQASVDSSLSRGCTVRDLLETGGVCVNRTALCTLRRTFG